MNTSFVAPPDLAQTLVHLMSIDSFRVFLKALEERAHELALGAAQPEMQGRRDEMCGRVQELCDIIACAEGAHKRVVVPLKAAGKGW